MDTFHTDAVGYRAWVIALSYDPVEYLIHKSALDDTLTNAGDDADRIVRIAWKKMEALIAQNGHRMYADRSQAEIHTQTRKRFLDMQLLGNISAAN